MARNRLGITDAGRVEVPHWHFPHITQRQILWITILVCLSIGFSLLGLSQTLWNNPPNPSINLQPSSQQENIPLVSSTTTTPNPNLTPLPKITTKWETGRIQAELHPWFHGVPNFVFLDKTGDTVVAAGYSGILRTEDGGKTWVSVKKATSMTRVVADPINPQTLYVGTRSEGILESIDGGKTWTTHNGDLPEELFSREEPTEWKSWLKNLPLSPASCGYVFSRDANSANIIIGALLPGGVADLEERIRLGMKLPDSRPIARDVTFFISLDGGNLWQEINPPPPLDKQGLDGSSGRSAPTPTFGIISIGNSLKILVSEVPGDSRIIWQTSILIK